jgi:hypothetical protein
MYEMHTKAIENSRKSACSAIDIVEWFELLKECGEEFESQDVDVCKFDEAGSCRQLERSSCICSAEIKKTFRRDVHNRELATCIECISSVRKHFRPL